MRFVIQRVRESQVTIDGETVGRIGRGFTVLIGVTHTDNEEIADKMIRKLIGKVKEKGYTLIPTRVYFKGNYAKVEIALAKGKKLYDKRETIAKKDQRREAERDYKISKMY